MRVENDGLKKAVEEACKKDNIILDAPPKLISPLLENDSLMYSRSQLKDPSNLSFGSKKVDKVDKK